MLEDNLINTINIGIIGDFDPANPSQIATVNALYHAAESIGIDIRTTWLPTGEMEKPDYLEVRQTFDGFWCGPGSPYQSFKGALEMIRFCREKNRPFLGT